MIALVGLVAWGVIAGSASAYAHAFGTTSMVHVMSIDRVVCAALLAVLVEEDRGRRAAETESAFVGVMRFIPLFGPALWNAFRSPREPLRAARSLCEGSSRR